ncbi:hypothetical protein FE784_03610 [Paenibacillus hemerocallicola]|uniref:Glycoside hydrolase family 20 catalytic domain-containing protein n=1 Tax=Paenibacillus hemerocallicola TaxID=1172614 RepID=A0A5C4TFC1_9BACL|nr:family 20 glycosylhydrolase [Paenibacillus hemerocallicola]TNJ67844.1 hypothetical protein FE784_03610 [Paenibacillus hemerocallicola]
MVQIKGFMYDVSDGMKGGADYIEKMMVRLSGYGYNMLVLYLEHCFQFPSHPAIGTNESLTPADIQRLDEVAAKLGMDLVPLVNIAGHTEGFGFLEAYKHMCADPTGQTRAVGQLLVDSKDSLQLLEELYADIFATFKSKYIHIGADEIYTKYQLLDIPEEQRFAIAADRVIHMIELVKRKGRIPLLWGDMFLKNEETIARIPDEAIICDWAYFSDPQFKGLSNVKSQQTLKNAGKKTVAFPAINHFYGNPVVSVNSTMNITAFYQDHLDVFGDEALGTILCVWGTEAGTFFTTSWPWLYLQGKLFAGEKSQGMDFMREYTRLEWGVDTNGLAEWYDLVDVQVQKVLLFEAITDDGVRNAVQGYNNRPYKLLRLFVRDVFRMENPLPVLNDARKWMTPKVRAELRTIFEKAVHVAERMHSQAQSRQEEPRMLLEWTHLFIHVLNLLDQLEQAGLHYNQAARHQGLDQERYASSLADCVKCLRQMEQTMGALIRWAELSIELEDSADYESWWVREGQGHIRRMADELETGKSGRRGLVNFEVFIRINPSVPFAGRRWKMLAH